MSVVYPYFIEKGKMETDPVKRKFLFNLGIGLGALTRRSNDEKRDAIVVADNRKKEFIIPSETDASVTASTDDIFYMFWTKEFVELSDSIRNAKSSWINMKKKERLRLVDEYVSSAAAAAGDNRTRERVDAVRAAISMALLLKLVSHKDIEYQDFKVTDIKTTDLFGVRL